MINVKNIILNKNTYRFFLGSLAISQSISAYKNSKIELPEKISESITFSLTDYDEFNEPNIYFLDDISKIGDTINSLEDARKVNLTYTKNNFSHVKEIDIDIAKSDINDLYKFPKLEKLTLYNYDFLTDTEKKTINNISTIKEINFDSNYRMLSTSNDFSWVKSDIKIKIINSTNTRNDLEDLYLYKLFNNIKEENKNIEIDYFDEDRFYELSDWDKKIESIVKTFDFTELTSVEDKVLTLTEYVTTTFSYDKDVSNAIKEGMDPNQNEKTLYYNKNLLKSFLTDENFDGICCNYAALLSLLGNYSGVNLRYTTGTYGEGINNGHAWCEYGDIKIDPTVLDSSTQYNRLKVYLNRYEEYMSPMAIDAYKNILLDIIEITNTDNSYDDYKEREKQEIKKEIKYENVYADQYKKMVKNKIKTENEIVLLTLMAILLTIKPKYKNKVKVNVPNYI